MGLADRLQLAYLALRGGGKAVQIVPTWEIGRARPLPVDYETLVRDGYQRNEIVYACIRYIANSAAAAPIIGYAKDGTELDELHPLMSLLARPNAIMSGSDLIETLLVMLNIAGDAFFEKERANGGQVVGLWPMRPDRVDPVAGKYAPESYVYTVGDVSETFKARDVLHFRYYNPIDDVFGQSPLAVCARATDADNERTDFTRTFFSNAAVPYGLLQTKVKLTETEARRIQERWQDQHAGTSRWHKVAVLDSDATYQRLGLTQSEMDFSVLTELSETRICAAFRISPILIGAQAGMAHSTYSNYAESRRTFWQDTMVPTLTKIADALTEGLAREFDDARIEFDFSQVTALQEAEAEQWTRAQSGVAGGWVSVNEARQIVGLEPIAGGAVFLRGLSVSAEPAIPEDEAGDVAPETTPAEESEEDEVTEAQDEAKALMLNDIDDDFWEQGDPASRLKLVCRAAMNSLAHEREVTEAQDEAKGVVPYVFDVLNATSTKRWEPFYDARLQAAAIQRLNLIARAWEGRLTTLFRDLFREQYAEIEAAFPPSKGRQQKADWVTTLFTIVRSILEHSKGAWIERIFPFLVALAGDQSDATKEIFGVVWDIESRTVREFIQAYTFKFVDKLTDVSADQLTELFDKARVEGWSIPDIQRELRELYDGWSEQRAEMIARTESIRASNAGIKAMYRQAGVTQLKWVTTADDRLCEFCREMDGKIIGIDEVYFRQGETMIIVDEEGKSHNLKLDYEDVEHPPLHVMCRCALVAAD